MKNIKKILTLGLGLGLLGGSLVAAGAHKNKNVQAEALHDVAYEKFVPMLAENLESAGFANVGDHIRSGHPSYWDNRYYGTTENVLDTVDIMGDKKGDFRTQWFKQEKSTAEKKMYITFLLGGNTCNNTFLNIWDETQGRDVYDHIKNVYYSDPDLRLNMCFRYFEMPTDIDGNRMLIYFNEDGGTTNCEGITFSELRINQTWDDVVASYRNFLLGYKLSSSANSENLAAYNAIMNLHNNNADYAQLKASLNALPSLNNVNDNFEVNNALVDWVLDWNNTTAYYNKETVYSNAIEKKDDYFYNGMPFNQSDSYFLNEDANGFPEDQKYRLVSREFELSGHGFISAKLGGGTAVLELLDADSLEVLATTKQVYSTFEGQEIYNPGFNVPEGSRPELDMFATGARLNTMSRVYLDCHEHLYSLTGKKVRVALTDGRTGGGWGKAYFDDVRTNYSYFPPFEAQALSQRHYNGENLEWTHYGVVTDLYVGSSATTLGEAYSFVRTFWNTVRSLGSEETWCSNKDNASTVYASLISAYEGLSDDTVKLIVDSSTDFAFINGTTRTAYLTSEINTSKYTVGDTMNAIINGVFPEQGVSPSNLFKTTNNNSTTIVIIVISVISISSLVLLLAVKKRRVN